MNLSNLNELIANINLNAHSHLNQGLTFYNSGNRAAAILSLNRAIEIVPQNYHLYNIRGTIHEDDGSIMLAEKDFLKSLDLEPNNLMGAYRYGMILSGKKDLISAIKFLTIAISESADFDTETLGMGKDNIFFVSKKVIASNLANFHAQTGDYQNAIKYADIGIKLDPNYGNSYMAKGAALAQLGRDSEAISILQIAQRLGIPAAGRFIDYLRSSQ